MATPPLVTIDEVRTAAARIAPYVVRTPLVTCAALDRMGGCARVVLKPENLQRVGAFKARGALNAVMHLSDEEKRRGVIAHSSGNHAQALALAGQRLGVPVTIVMPNAAPAVKVRATRDTYGATVLRCDNTLEARETTTAAEQQRNDQVLVHPYDNRHVVAGAGTAALELIEDARGSPHDIERFDFVFVPVGGGGLMSGTALTVRALMPTARVIACEPVLARDAWQSRRSGTLVPNTLPTTTIADGLRTSLAPITFAHMEAFVDDVVLVTEDELLDAMRVLFERTKLVVEPSGAVPLAALFKLGKTGALRSKRCAVILSGGNVDLDVLFAHLRSSVQRPSLAKL